MTSFLTGTNRGLGGLKVEQGSTEVFGVNHIVFTGGATLTDNSNGKVTVAISGGGGGGSMTSWTIAGASGSTVVNDGETVTITGSNGITTAESGRTVSITPTGVLEDLSALDAPTDDGQFIVATNAGEFQYESGATARASLGLGSAATQDTGTFLQVANDLSDLSDAETARTNLELGTMATQDSSAVDITGGNIQAYTLFPDTFAPFIAGSSLNLGDAFSGDVFFGVPDANDPVTFSLGGVGSPGFQCTIVNIGLGQPVIITCDGSSQTINGLTDPIQITTQYNAVSIVTYDGENFVAIGV